MVVDYRAYTFKPGTVPIFLDLFERVGLPVQNRILGREAFIGIYRTEIGNVNEVIHMWRYADAQQRAVKRELLFKDVEFMEYVVKVREIITHQDVRLLLPLDFNPRIGG
jgi:NIPSNAP